MWVMWVLAFFGGAAWNRAVNDPPIYAVATSWGIFMYNVADVAFTIGVVLVALAAIAAFALVTISAVRKRDWTNFRRLLPCLVLMAIEVALFMVIRTLRYSPAVTQHAGYKPFLAFPVWFQAMIAVWLLLLIPLILTAIRGPVLALRNAALSPRVLRVGYWFGFAAATCLLFTAVAAASLLLTQFVQGDIQYWSRDPYFAIITFYWLSSWMQTAATIGLVGVAVTAVTSTVRGARAARLPLQPAE